MKKWLAGLALVTLVAVGPAEAQFNPGATTSQDMLQINNTGPFSPVGTYTGQLLASPGQPMLDVWCNDFFNGIISPQAVNVTRFDAAAGDFTARTRFGFAQLDNYMKAAVLATYLRGAADLETATDIHWALWRLFGANPGAVRAGEAAWVATAQAEYLDIDLEDWFVLTGEEGLGQEFLAQSIVPEPATMVLVATGLIGLAGAARIRRRQQRG